MLSESVVKGLMQIVRDSIDSTRHRFPPRDAWRSLDNDGVWKLIVYQVAVVGNSASQKRLKNSTAAQETLRYEFLRDKSPDERALLIHKTLRDHVVSRAARDITKCRKTHCLARNLQFLAQFSGGPTGYLNSLSLLGEEERIERVMRDLSYIKQKGARDLLAELGLAQNIIALDARVLGVLRSLGANVPKATPSDPAQYKAIQQDLFTLVCEPLGITGVELDRILYWNCNRV